MNEIGILTEIELRSLYGINRVRYTKDKKKKRRYFGLCIAWAFVLIMVIGYTGGLVYGLVSLGLSDIVPAYLIMIESLLIFIFGIFKAGGKIFSPVGYDIISSMPIKTSSVVISRFIVMYVEELFLTIIIMLTGTVTYGVLCRPTIMFYIVSAIGAMFIPAIPIVLSTVIGTLITAATAGMRHKSIVQTILLLMVIMVSLIMSYSSGYYAENLTSEMLTKIGTVVGEQIGRLYPPAVWLGNAMTDGGVISLLLFITVSAASVALTVWIVSLNFSKIIRRMLVTSARHDYKLGKLESRGILKTLYIKEFKRYFSSSIYVTNTIIGPIMGCLLSAGLLITGIDTITSSLPPEIDVTGLIPFVLTTVFCLMSTTSVSISMEGKQIWVVKSMPIPVKSWLDSKLLLNLSIMLPFYLVSVVLISIATRPTLTELLWLVLIPAVFMLFTTVFGITINLWIHKFDWEKEESIVKQSASSFFGGFAGTLTAFILGIVAFIVPPDYGNIIKAVICAVIFGITVLLYNKNNKASLSKL